jgi:branched-chain amino acid transport system substrate-binding protein
LQVVFNEEYASTATDVSGLIQKAKAANVDLFLSLSLPNDSALMVRAANSQNFKPKIFCACGAPVTTLASFPDLGAAAEGIISTGMAMPTDKFNGIADLWAYLQKERNQKELSQFAIYGYAGLQVMEQAVKATNSLDQEKLRNYVVSGNKFELATGTKTYDKNGIPNYSALVLQFTGGRNQVLWPPDRATAKPIMPLP